MKSLFTTLLLLTLAACSGPRDGALVVEKSENAQGGGGVDVGNLTSAAVPNTNASVSFPSSWVAEQSEAVLVLKNTSGSKIQAQKSEITDLVSPTASSLKQYLEAKYPDRRYELITVNGLSGVRAELSQSATEKKSDLFLVSETSDFIHIQSSLKEENKGITTGDEIIASVRVKYRGEAILDSVPKTITLQKYRSDSNGNQTPSTYSFNKECYTRFDKSCFGTDVAYGYNNKDSLRIGLAGYDSGRIIDLGSENEIPFDSIKIDKDYLVAPATKISIADIYTAFTPKDQHAEKDEANLQKGHVYLIRTISWPSEDVIVKVKVDELVSGTSVTLTYQKLIFVQPKVLQQQVEQMNTNTIQNEQPISEGEVTLYSRATYNNYFYASFNFEYSTSGNMFITRNSWDIHFSSSEHGTPFLTAGGSGGEVTLLTDFGAKPLSAIQKSDFPDANLYKTYRGLQNVKKGNVYGVLHHRFNDKIGVIYAAVQVLDIAPDASWVRLKFRRIYMGPAEHFQKWTELKVTSEIKSLQFGKTDTFWQTVFYPFTDSQKIDGGYMPSERLSFWWRDPQTPSVSVDIRPYGKDKGAVLLGRDLNLNSITVADIEKQKGNLISDLNFEKGDVIGLYLENYFEKTILVMKVEKAEPGQPLQLTYKRLYNAKAIYSDYNENEIVKP